MPDSQPNYLTTDPVTGAVGAKFSGHLSAHGIDFPAYGSFGIPEVARQDATIEWRASSNGAQVAFIRTYADAELELRAKSPNGAHTAGLRLYAENSTLSPNTIMADVDSQSRAILDTSGSSDFAQPGKFFTQRFTGPWATGGPVVPGGISFTASGGPALVICSATAWTTNPATGLTMWVYLDGTFYMYMELLPNCPGNAHTLLNPGIFTTPSLTAGSTHYIWFQLAAGTSDNGDRGTVTVIQ